MKLFFFFSLVICALQAKPSYTAYSGAAGSKGTCASSCHGSGIGTITVSGFPSTYIPLTLYTVSIKHNGGSTISNFNASTRKGSATIVAGTFTAGSNSAVYSVLTYENGIRASVNNIDEAMFQWLSPAAGSGEVKFYLSGLQGSKSGATTKIVMTSAENITGVDEQERIVDIFGLKQNFPNPFNPSTVIKFQIPVSNVVTLKVFDILGNTVATLVNEHLDAGEHQAVFESKGLSSGVYYYSLQTNDHFQTKKMIVLK